MWLIDFLQLCCDFCYDFLWCFVVRGLKMVDSKSLLFSLWNKHVLVRGAVLKLLQRRLFCWEYVDHAYNIDHFCICGREVLVTDVYVRVVKEGESQHRIAALWCVLPFLML